MTTQKPSKSPFLLIEDFLTLQQCEDIVLSMNHTIPDRNRENYPIKTFKTNTLAEIRIISQLDDFLDKAEPHYGFKTQAISPFQFEWYAEGFQGDFPKADNGIYVNGKWLKSINVDFSIIIFLSTSKTTSITDTVMECFGGTLEFLNHNLTIKPKAGTMLMFPANSHFLNTFTEVGFGNLNCIRIHIASEVPYEYKPENFPGDYRTWFK